MVELVVVLVVVDVDVDVDVVVVVAVDVVVVVVVTTCYDKSSGFLTEHSSRGNQLQNSNPQSQRAPPQNIQTVSAFFVW